MREGFFRKDEFRYDARGDAYVCPAGQLLMPIRHGRLRDLEKIEYGAPKACPVKIVGRVRCDGRALQAKLAHNEPDRVGKATINLLFVGPLPGVHLLVE